MAVPEELPKTFMDFPIKVDQRSEAEIMKEMAKSNVQVSGDLVFWQRPDGTVIMRDRK